MTTRRDFLRRGVERSGALALLLLTGAGLSACTTPDPTKRFPELTFQNLGPIGLTVSNVEVVDTYTPPLKRPNVEHRFDASPAKAMANWARARLKPQGGVAKARFTVTDASVVERKLALDEGFTGTFKKEQSERYEISLKGELEILDAAGRRLGHSEAAVTRSQTVREDATLNDVREVWFKLVEDAMASFDQEMEKNVRQFLANWVQTPVSG